MQMIDVLKRLAELDAKNPNVVKQPVSEVSVNYAANKVAGAMRDPKLGWPRAAQTLDKMSSKFGSDKSNKAVQKASEKMTADEMIPDLIDNIRARGTDNAFWDLEPSLQQSVSFLQHFADALDAEGMEAHADDVRDGLETAKRRQGVAEGLEECGMMGGMSHQPHSPASINMTAATGEELSSMLKDIMTLAGRPIHEPMGGEEPMGGTNGIATVDVEPSPEVGADEPSIMRSMLDKLNPADDDVDGEQPSDDDEEKKTDETVDSMGEKPNNIPPFDANNFAHQPNQLGQGDRMDGTMPKGNPTFESLMAEYRKFVAENIDPNRLFGYVYDTKNRYLGIWNGQRLKIDSNVWQKWKDENGEDWASDLVHMAKDKIARGAWKVRSAGPDDQDIHAAGPDDQDIHAAGPDDQEENPKEESLKDFFSNLRSEVEQGMNVVDTFHDKVDQLPDELPAEIVQFLRDQSAEADGAQDDPEEMKSIMLAAIDKVENTLGLKNTMEQETEESQDILRLAGIR